MLMSKVKGNPLGFLLAVAVCILCAPPALAETLQSTNYQFGESTLGQGGVPNSSSSNYQGSSSTGDLGVGQSSSTSYNQQGGSQTTPFPTLTVNVTGASVILPEFSYTTPSMGTNTFSVINYTSYGYVVLIDGDPPSNSGHTIAAMATPDTSSPGFEQFGINLVANTAPQSIGANPDQGNFGFGIAEADYDTPNNYKYVNGDTIASAPKSSGQTDYTISYLVNVAQLTPGGQYTTNQSIIVVGTY